MADNPTYCAEHGDTPTSLRCTRCEKPVCPHCMVQAPVGIRCREHGQGQKLPTYQVSRGFLARGVAASLTIGVLGGVLLAVLVLPILPPFASLFAMAGFGYVVSEGISRATNYKRGRPLIIAAAMGILAAFAIAVFVDTQTALTLDLFDLLGLGVAIYVAFIRLR